MTLGLTFFARVEALCAERCKLPLHCLASLMAYVPACTPHIDRMREKHGAAHDRVRMGSAQIALSL